MNVQPIRRTIHPEVRIVDGARGVCDFVASDETLDYYREIIRASGWRFTHFARNAPLVDSHNYWSVDKLLGKVTDFRVEGRQLVERVQFAIDVEEQPLARLAWRLIEAKYLKACSVGFVPTSMVTRWGDEKAWADAVKDLGLDADTAAKVRVIYLEQEQIELSVCIIGANPAALAKAYKAGVMSDDDMAAIERTAEAARPPDIFRTETQRTNAASAPTPARAKAARGRERSAWLRNLKHQIKKL